MLWVFLAVDSLDRLKEKLQEDFHALSDFKWVWVSLVSVCGISPLVHAFWWPSALKFLSLSIDKPWGLITSAFVHKDLDHLFGNLWPFIAGALVFVGLNSYGDGNRRRNSSRESLCSGFHFWNCSIKLV